MIKDEGIDVRSFKIIYQFLEDLQKLNESMNEDYRGIEVLGKATVKELYDIKLGTGSR
jgi:translation initiation factor IF-2